MPLPDGALWIVVAKRQQMAIRWWIIAVSLVPPVQNLPALIPMQRWTVCKHQVVQPGSPTILFSKPVRCGFVASNAMVQTLTSPVPVQLLSTVQRRFVITMDSHIWSILLSAPFIPNGSYKLVLQKGSDGNTLLDACGNTTLKELIFLLQQKDTRNAWRSVSKKGW